MGTSLTLGEAREGSGVGVLDKAIGILAVLEDGPSSLGDLARSTGLPRATAHRLATALECHGLVGRDGSGRFVLGPRLADLGRRVGTGAPGLVEAAAPPLAELRDRTGESTQLYVASGDRRVCIVALESSHSLRTIVAVGASLPMGLGSAGHVLSGVDPGEGGWIHSVEERERGVASVSAPVVVDGHLLAAVSVSGPVERTTRQPGLVYGEAVAGAARAVERRLAGSRPPRS